MTVFTPSASATHYYFVFLLELLASSKQLPQRAGECSPQLGKVRAGTAKAFAECLDALDAGWEHGQAQEGAGGNPSHTSKTKKKSEKAGRAKLLCQTEQIQPDP